MKPEAFPAWLPIPGVRRYAIPGVLLLSLASLGGCSNGRAHCARLDPQLVSCPAPKRPPGRDLRGGHVEVELMVLPNGTVAEPRILSSTGNPAWEYAVLHAVRRWEFKPAQHAYRKVIPFDFRTGGKGPAEDSSTRAR